MKIFKLFKMLKSFSFMLLALFTLFSSIAFAETPSPMPMLNAGADELIQDLETQKSHLTPAIVYDIVNKCLIPHVDVYGMSRSVLGRNEWNKATDEQKKAFSEQFVQLIVRTYSTPLTKYTDEKIKFLPIRQNYEGKNFVGVNSLVVHSSGKPVPVNYSLVLINNEWKIYDMSVEGVSLLQSFRSQFAQELKNGNLDQLIQNMQKHNTQKSRVA